MLQYEWQRSQDNHKIETKSEKIVDFYSKQSLEEIFKSLSDSNYDNSNGKMRKKNARKEKHKVKKQQVIEGPKDDEDFYEHSGSQNEMTTMYPTTTDLNDTTIIFDDNNEMEIVGTS